MARSRTIVIIPAMWIPMPSEVRVQTRRKVAMKMKRTLWWVMVMIKVIEIVLDMITMRLQMLLANIIVRNNDEEPEYDFPSLLGDEFGSEDLTKLLI